MKRTLTLAAILTVAAWAGGLTLQIANPDANAEAKSLNATLVATASRQPDRTDQRC